MQIIFDEIQTLRKEFEKLSFFKFLEDGDQIDDANIFVPGLAFFVLTFQDILRLNEEHITNPKFAPIIELHRQEDLGHDAWFLHDLKQLGTDCPATLLFGDQFVETRDASFEIVSEIYRATDDRVRLVIPLALEAAGHVFFSRVFHFFSRTGYSGQLKYFSKEHFEVEKDHELFEDDINDAILAIDLSEALKQEAKRVISRIFQALSKMVSALQQKIESRKALASYI